MQVRPWRIDVYAPWHVRLWDAFRMQALGKGPPPWERRKLAHWEYDVWCLVSLALAGLVVLVAYLVGPAPLLWLAPLVLVVVVGHWLIVERRHLRRQVALIGNWVDSDWRHLHVLESYWWGLHYEERQIALDSAEWFAWLDSPENRTFRVAATGGNHYTCRKERTQKGSGRVYEYWYWRRYSHKRGHRMTKQRHGYIGRSDTVTRERLVQVAEDVQRYLEAVDGERKRLARRKRQAKRTRSAGVTAG
jgi:hypothetical protein